MAYRRGRYWYRSVRVGRRVIKEYLGTGELAQTMAEIDALKQRERDLAREAIRAERTRENEIDRELDALGAHVRELTGGCASRRRGPMAGWMTHTPAVSCTTGASSAGEVRQQI